MEQQLEATTTHVGSRSSSDSDDKKIRRIKTTLAEQGDKLPIGILDTDGRLHKTIVTKPWNTRDERELGKKFPSDASMAEHVPLIVANMCSKLGPHDMERLDDAQKRLIVSMMYMADVFYAYTLLRVKTMSHRLTLNVNCPRAGCGVNFPYTGDLRTLDVMTVDEIDDILWRYDLEVPITLRRQQVTHFKCAYPKWNAIEQARGNTNEAEVKAIAIQASIVGLNDALEPVALTLHEIDELSKPDFEGIQATLNENYLGPKMGLEGQCRPEVCTRLRRGGFEFNLSIDWAYRNFFGASSR